MENPFIKELPHQPTRPVSVERTFPDGLLIEGVNYHGDFFRTMGSPKADFLYSIERDGDMVTIRVIANVDEAKAFFEKSGGA